MLTVGDVMTPHPVITGPEETVTRALAAMRERGISSVLVSPPAGAIAYGIVTMRDLISKIVKFGLDPDAVKVGEITSWRLITAERDWSVPEAARKMTEGRVRRLPVMDRDGLAGLVSDTDLFTTLVPQHEWEHARVVRKERALRRAAETAPARTVGDLMSAPVLTVPAAAPVQESVEKMVASGVASLLVPAGGGPAGGIITKRDIVTKVLARDLAPRALAVGAVMSSPVLTIDPGATIEECSAQMSADGVRRFPVLEQGRIVGLISDSDILAAVAARRWWGQRGRRWPTAYIVADVMQPAPPGAGLDTADAVLPELSLWEAAARLARSAARALPVIQGGRVIGIVRRADILRALEERGGAD